MSSLTLFILVLVSCSGGAVPEPQPTPGGMDWEEYRVISASLRQLEDDFLHHTPEMRAARYHFADDTVAAKHLYDSLIHQYGDLTYYFVMENRTVKPKGNPLDCDWGESSAKISKELLHDFDSVKANLCGFEKEFFTDSITVELIPGPSESVTECPWKSLQFVMEPFPLAREVLCLSRVGFNERRTMALVYWESWSGWMAAGGKYLLLEKKKNAWKIAGIAKAWSFM